MYDPEGSERDKEKYYHAFLTGLILGKGGWGVLSNKESGEGCPDIMVKMNESDKDLVIKIKSARTFSSLDSECDKALKQIHTRHYEEYLINDGRCDILFYAIAFYKKRCRVKAGKPV